MKGKIYLNGKFLDSDSAKVSVTDFGFLYAGGVYEVILFHNRQTYKMEDHLIRLQQSSDLIGLNIKTSLLAETCQKLIDLNQVEQGMIYIQATFGDYQKRMHVIPREIEPTVLILLQEHDHYSEELFTSGVKIQSAPDTRWVHCNIKSIALLPNLLALNDAAEKGYSEVVFKDESTDFITECASSNIFCVKDQTVFTPPESNKILSGITRSTILELARENGIKAVEENFTLDFLCQADEVFISSTTREIVPVNTVDSRIFSSVPGDITIKMMRYLVEDLEEYTGGKHWKRSLLKFI
jgi:D-alanine transaminase